MQEIRKEGNVHYVQVKYRNLFVLGTSGLVLIAGAQ